MSRPVDSFTHNLSNRLYLVFAVSVTCGTLVYGSGSEDGSEDRIYLRYPRITWQMINYDSNRKYSRSSYIIFVATICASLAESVRQPSTTAESLSILGSMMDVQLFARNCTPQRIGDMLLCAAYNMVARPCRFVLGAQANTVRQIRHGSLTS